LGRRLIKLDHVGLKSERGCNRRTARAVPGIAEVSEAEQHRGRRDETRRFAALDRGLNLITLAFKMTNLAGDLLWLQLLLEIRRRSGL
jgi:hypothetical protein